MVKFSFHFWILFLVAVSCNGLVETWVLGIGDLATWLPAGFMLVPKSGVSQPADPEKAPQLAQRSTFGGGLGLWEAAGALLRVGSPACWGWMDGWWLGTGGQLGLRPSSSQLLPRHCCCWAQPSTPANILKWYFAHFGESSRLPQLTGPSCTHM